MSLIKKFLVVIALMTFVGSSAFAATNIYDDTYTTEDSSGNWTFGADVTISTGTFVRSKAPIEVISTTTTTAGTVTAAKSGYTFVLDPPAGGQSTPGGVGYLLTLPSAFSGATYTFVTATNSTLSVRTVNSNIIDFGNNPSTRIISPSSTGSTVTLIGGSSEWYVQSMTTGGSNQGQSAVTWTVGSA